MQSILLKKGLVIGIIVLFIGLSVSSSTGIIRKNHDIEINKINETISGEILPINNDAEYWALLIGGGLYLGRPDANMPELITMTEMLYEKLLISEHWEDKNIRVIKGIRANLCNIIRGFRWLDRKEDENDISMVFITTHGGQLKDKWPYDEEDGVDETLVTFLGSKFPWVNLRDDLFSMLISLLDSKSICVIIDSTFAGGFNDAPFDKNRVNDNKIDANEWICDFGYELTDSGRVVIMCCREDEIPYVGFTFDLIEGLTGYADVNEDDWVSAEEAFYFAEEKYENVAGMHPIMFDEYPGELQLTIVEFPPSIPEAPIGQIVGDINTEYYYSTVSIDLKGDNIRYGWDWDGDFNVDEWTDFIASNTTINISHSWAVEGTYNIRVKAEDEKGLISDWSKPQGVMMCSDNVPDQKQTFQTNGVVIFTEVWIAQSFIPTLDTLSKVDLSYSHWGNSQPLTFYIRENKSGDNLAETSKILPITGDDKNYWFTFDFDDISVIPGKTYYIITKGVSGSAFLWRGLKGNPYPLGKSWWSVDETEWHSSEGGLDFSFVTWGSKI